MVPPRYKTPVNWYFSRWFRSNYIVDVLSGHAALFCLVRCWCSCSHSDFMTETFNGLKRHEAHPQHLFHPVGNLDDSCPRRPRHLAPGAAKMDGTAVTRQRVAIVTAGTVTRCHLDASAEHLVAPLVQSGWDVDYFSSFFLGVPSAWRAGKEVFEADWEFQQANETQV